MTAKTKTAGRLFVAVDSFQPPDLDFPVVSGVTRVREGHWLLDKYPAMFAELDAHYEVEQMTAAPGERRGQ